MKMANMDAVFDFMFSSPRTKDKVCWIKCRYIGNVNTIKNNFNSNLIEGTVYIHLKIASRC